MAFGSTHVASGGWLPLLALKVFKIVMKEKGSTGHVANASQRDKITGTKGFRPLNALALVQLKLKRLVATIRPSSAVPPRAKRTVNVEGWADFPGLPVGPALVDREVTVSRS